MMNPEALEELSPSYMREKRIDVTVAASTPIPRAFQAILLEVSYTRTMPDGVMLPLVLEVQGPSAASYQRREFASTLPSAIVVVPREGGRHLIVLREAAHNRWWGSVELDVEGELLEPAKEV